MTDKIIMYESDEAATYKEGIKGWVSSTGQYCGNNEHLARYAGSTHSKCECGNTMSRGWLKCDECRAQRSNERYQALEFQEWNGEPVVEYDNDQYFFDEDDLREYIEEHESNELQFVICEPNIAPYIEEYALDLLPEDLYIDDIAPELAKMIGDINDYISKNKPVISWGAGKRRTTIKFPDAKQEVAS